MLLYSDDAVFLIRNPVKSLRVLKDVLKAYGEASGYRVNENKSMIMGSGAESYKKM